MNFTKILRTPILKNILLTAVSEIIRNIGIKWGEIGKSKLASRTGLIVIHRILLMLLGYCNKKKLIRCDIFRYIENNFRSFLCKMMCLFHFLLDQKGIYANTMRYLLLKLQTTNQIK